MGVTLFWKWFHNVVAHGIEGWWAVFSLDSPTPAWLDRFHGWTAGKAYGHEDEGRQSDRWLCEVSDLMDTHGPDAPCVEAFILGRDHDPEFVRLALLAQRIKREARYARPGEARHARRGEAGNAQ